MNTGSATIALAGSRKHGYLSMSVAMSMSVEQHSFP